MEGVAGRGLCTSDTRPPPSSLVPFLVPACRCPPAWHPRHPLPVPPACRAPPVPSCARSPTAQAPPATLALTKAADKATYLPGELITFTISVRAAEGGPAAAVAAQLRAGAWPAE